MATSKSKGAGASLNPADFTSGGAVPDGRYTIKAVQCVEFDYGGSANAVPALAVVYTDGVTDYSQNYSAGKLENLIPSEDGSEFVHPGGDDAKIGKSSNVGAFVAAMVNAGFPPNELTTKVTCFLGADIDIVNQAQQKRPGLKDQVEGKTIPLPVKYYGRAKAGKGARPTSSAAAPSAGKSAASAAASNGSLDASAIERVQEALASAPDNTLSIVKCGTQVWLAATKAKDKNATEYKKLAGNAEWLTEHAEEGGWTTDGETVTIG